MAVITISRQLGSLGREVATLVAERLGYRFVWRDMINEAARRASAPEVELAIIDELNLLGLSPTPTARKSYCEAVQKVMEELAREGNVVILGRAGQVILHKRPATLHVRIIAPVDLRVQRVADQQKIALTAARAQVEASDDARRDFLERYYESDWDDVDLYDLVLNTARLAPDQAADLVCHAVGQQQSARSASHV
jgi:cytidylate kinase